MTNDELKIWFLDKINSCYPVKHDDFTNNFFLYYDVQFVRKIKLSKINNQDIKYPSKIKGDCLFELDTKNEYIYCDYDKIWSFLESNYSSNYDDVQSLINGWLNDIEKMNVYTTSGSVLFLKIPLKDIEKMNVYTPSIAAQPLGSLLKDIEKMNVYTSEGTEVKTCTTLTDTKKLKVYTPSIDLNIINKKI